MSGNIKLERNNIILNTGEVILVDTCSLIEGDKYEFLLSNLKCLSTEEAYKELLRVANKKLTNISVEIVEESPDIKNEAKKLYRRYGLVWGVSYVDCLNLAWAKLNGKPLMTCDRALLKVAQKEGVKTVPMLSRGKQRISIVFSKIACENVSFMHPTKSEEVATE
jgi:predicted nucleic acid-binding protein